MSEIIDVNIINPFLKSSIDIIKQVCNIDIKVGKPFISKTSFNNESILIILGITGQMEGQVILDIEIDKAKSIASSMMMGMQVDTLDEMAMSAISELGNMIMGNTATLFSAENILVDITPPSVAHGTLTINRYYTYNICIPFYSEDKKLFNMNVAVKSK